MTGNKFEPGEKVILKQFMVNGSRLDIEAEVVRYVRHGGTKKMNVEVIVNDTRLTLPEERLTKEDNGKTKG